MSNLIGNVCLRVSSVAAFDPASLITGIGGFWRADRGVVGGSTVTQWNDQSVLGTNLTPGAVPSITGTAPAFSSTGFNSLFPGITFGGAGTANTLGVAVGAYSTSTLSVFMLINTGSVVNS